MGNTTLRILEEQQIPDSIITTKVPIRDELLTKLPVPILQSRLGFATILAYTGYKQEIFYILQKLSHGSRAYLFNAKGLPGFLSDLPSPSPIMNLFTIIEKK